MCDQFISRTRGGGKPIAKQPNSEITEETPGLVIHLANKLDNAHQTINTLVEVYKQFGEGYNRDVAYNEQIRDKQAQESKVAAEKAEKKSKGSKKTFNTKDNESILGVMRNTDFGQSISQIGATGNNDSRYQIGKSMTKSKD